jgi:glyoxylase-like metal-dependent hydrolase (beta-lactamase superfamily II)
MSDQLPTKTQHGLSAFILKIAHSAPMPGGDMANGNTRILSAHSSAYLFPMDATGKAFALIDSGMDPQAAEIIATLQAKGVGPDAIKAIFVTHGHSDHTGGIRAFPSADVYVGAGDRGFVEGREAAEGFLPHLGGKQPKIAIADPAKLHTVTDGETVTVGTKTVRCFTVPGHTRGSVAYLVDDTLHLGDAAYFDTAGRARKAPPPVSADLRQSLRSLAGLVKRFDDEGIRVTTVTSGHSGEGTFDALRDLAKAAK